MNSIKVVGRDGREAMFPIQQGLIPDDIKSLFPNATGIYYKEDEVIIAIIARNNEYIEPHGGWMYPNRIYYTQEVTQPVTAEKAVEEKEPKQSGKLHELLGKLRSGRANKGADDKLKVPGADISLKLVLLDSSEKPARKSTILKTFSGEENFEDVLNICNAAFDVDSAGVKIGQYSSAKVESFEGKHWYNFMKQNKICASKAKIYVLAKETTEHKSQPSAHKRTQSPVDTKVPPKKKADDGISAKPPVPVIRPCDLERGEEIGSGGMARVFKGAWNGTNVAIKVCTLPNKNIANAISNIIETEVKMHASLFHPNVVQFLGISRSNRSISIVTELMEGSLQDKIFPDEGVCEFNLERKIDIAKEILKGLVFLHRNGIVHGDMKPGNVLLSKSGSIVKICDMGLSKVKKSVQATQTTGSIAGTVLYLAPENLLNQVRTCFSSDVWAYAATVCELISEEDFWIIPEEEKDTNEYIKNQMRKKDTPPALKAVQKRCSELKTILTRTLSYNFSTRPSATELFALMKDLQ